MEINQSNNMDGVFNTSEYLTNLLVNVIGGQGHPRSRGLRKVKVKIPGCCGMLYVLGQTFVKNAKNGSRTLFELPKSDTL